MSDLDSLPTPPRERWPLAVALVALLAGAGLLGVALGHTFTPGHRVAQAAAAAPPAAPQVVVVTPTAQTVAPQAVQEAPAPKQVDHKRDEQRFAVNDRAHVPAAWVARFYPIYAQAQKTFGVNWLLIASVHKQETAFSTHPTTYHGLNFARCCAGPMQFNVTNGPLTTWARYKGSSAQAPRPAGVTDSRPKHPSVYDDYDAIMAAAALLRDSGATLKLDAGAWRAAYDYYGHDLTGVSYADEVLARAIGWGQHRFCINCATDASIQTAVDAAWGAPVRAEMAAPPPPKKSKHAKKHDATALAASAKR
jgi:hypothetical protein